MHWQINSAISSECLYIRWAREQRDRASKTQEQLRLVTSTEAVKPASAKSETTLLAQSRPAWREKVTKKRRQRRIKQLPSEVTLFWTLLFLSFFTPSYPSSFVHSVCVSIGHQWMTVSRALACHDEISRQCPAEAVHAGSLLNFLLHLLDLIESHLLINYCFLYLFVLNTLMTNTGDLKVQEVKWQNDRPNTQDTVQWQWKCQQLS